MALLLVTLARPQHGFDLQEVEQHGLDIVVAMDTSKCMLATDIAPNRLARAKLAALELMQTAGTDRLGLVAFAGDAFLECPLTIDNTAFQQSVQALDVNTIPAGRHGPRRGHQHRADRVQGRTAITRCSCCSPTARTTTTRPARWKPRKTRRRPGLKIFTIGIGTPAGDLLRVTDANGNSDYVRDEQGNVVKSHLNETLLQQIATVDGRILSAVARGEHDGHRFTNAASRRCRNRRARSS